MRTPRVVRSALKVSLVVDTVLDIVNHGKQVWAHHTVTPWQATLNFVVPYCVSSCSAARDEAQRRQGD